MSAGSGLSQALEFPTSQIRGIPKFPQGRGMKLTGFFIHGSNFFQISPKLTIEKAQIQRNAQSPWISSPLHPTMNLTCRVLASDLSDGEV